ncbi:MalY/PatB family protein [Marinomonas pollencensis]|uniref:cysteine-S-conjugate beta-lyase n=1 Tax=Marinomonas pollencensis TaxID=491954 RepID=A0A3E0DPU9_9GAMM|nr:PatB family C-S lyase [Marinomonas pollencensis]REG84823.1 cystathionine beta-lyase [Marinomonas pollencensis]
MDEQMSCFDKEIERTNSQSDKWSKYPQDVIPLWVADMDFESPDCIKQALSERLDHGVFGYTHASKGLEENIIKHAEQRYNWELSRAQIVHLPGLVCALHLAVRAFSNEGDSIVVPSPIYPNFNKAVLNANRELSHVEMQIKNGRWVPDMQAFEVACAQPNSKMILLCNPHNPGGTVYTKAELEAIHQLAKRYDLLVVSDEIHCDLILDDLPHTPFASVNEDAANRTITLMAPSKTFNVAGLGYAFAVIANPTLRSAFNDAKAGLVPYPNLLGLTAASAAFAEGQDWHKSLLTYLKKNRDLIEAWLPNTPLKMVHLEATYLAWIDVSALQLDNPHQFFLAAGIGISDGKDFGNPNYIRLNFGCPKSRLEDAIKRINNALKKHNYL